MKRMIRYGIALPGSLEVFEQVRIFLILYIYGILLGWLPLCEQWLRRSTLWLSSAHHYAYESAVLQPEFGDRGKA